MRKLRITAAMVALGLGLGLSACATVPTPIQPSEVYDLAQAYGALQQGFVTYGQLPRCSAGGVVLCHNPKVLAAAQRQDVVAETAILALEQFVRNPANYPGLSYGQLLSTAQDALKVLDQIKAEEM